MYRAVLSLALAAVLISAGSAQDNPPKKDWPQWRGPNRDAACSETGLRQEWPKDGPKLLWSAREVNGKDKLGDGMSSIAIVSGRIYTLGDRDKAGNVVCLDEATGKVLWATPISPPRGGDGPSGARCTPTVDGNRLYALTPHGILACVDTQKGELMWTKYLKKDFGGHMMSGWNYSESPLVDGDKLICTPGGKEAAMIALDKKTGDVIWKCASKIDAGAGYASIVVAEAGGIRQYVTFLGNQLGPIGVHA